MKNKIGSYDEKWLEVSQTKPLKQIDDEKRAKLIISRVKEPMNKQNWMAFISYKKTCGSEIDNIFSAKRRSKRFKS